MAFYLDSSAAVKLVLADDGSAAMAAWAAAHAEEVVSSDLVRAELLRVTRRGAAEQMPRARAVLDSITLLELPAGTFEHAAELQPATLRTLDALHLAAALQLGDELDGVVTYDERLSAAASLIGEEHAAPPRTTVRPGDGRRSRPGDGWRSGSRVGRSECRLDRPRGAASIGPMNSLWASRRIVVSRPASKPGGGSMY